MTDDASNSTDTAAATGADADSAVADAGPHETLRADAALGHLVEEHGPFRIEPADDFFRRFLVSILRQQVSMASAAATRERLFDAVEPIPEQLLAADDSTLRDAGLSRQKTRYVNNVAEAFGERGWSRERFAGESDEAVRAELTSVTGVGQWTANMQLMFSLGRDDVFPVGDLGVRKGVEAVAATAESGEEMSRAEMVTYAERWAPYRTYASIYLWRVEEPIEDSVAEVRQA